MIKDVKRLKMHLETGFILLNGGMTTPAIIRKVSYFPGTTRRKNKLSNVVIERRSYVRILCRSIPNKNDSKIYRGNINFTKPLFF